MDEEANETRVRQPILILIGTINAKQNGGNAVEKILNKNFVDFERDNLTFNILSYTSVSGKDGGNGKMYYFLRSLKKELSFHSTGVLSVFVQTDNIKWGPKVN